MECDNNLFFFFSLAYYIKFPFHTNCLLLIFHLIAVGDVGLSFSINANAVEEETKWATWLYYQHNQSIHDWLCDSDITCYYPPTEDKCGHGSSMPNCVKTKIKSKFKECCKFSSCVKAKSHKKESRKMRPASILYLLAKILHSCSPVSPYHLQHIHYVTKSAIHLCCSSFSSCVWSCMPWVFWLLQWTDMSKN